MYSKVLKLKFWNFESFVIQYFIQISTITENNLMSKVMVTNLLLKTELLSCIFFIGFWMWLLNLFSNSCKVFEQLWLVPVHIFESVVLLRTVYETVRTVYETVSCMHQLYTCYALRMIITHGLFYQCSQCRGLPAQSGYFEIACCGS